LWRDVFSCEGISPVFPKLEGSALTLMLIEDTLSEEETVAQQFAPTVKCGWCGQIIRLDGNELALAMCQNCHDGMMAEFLRAQQMNSANRHASDR